MIKSFESINLDGLPLFTKLSVETPVKESMPLPSDACYAYIVEGEGQIFSEAENIAAHSGEVILSLCGFTVGQMIAEQPKGNIDSMIVHFNRQHLQQAFEGTKPEFWEELKRPITQYIVQQAASELVKHFFNGVNQLFYNQAALTDSILKIKLKEIVLLLLQADQSDQVRQIVCSLFSERQFTFKEIVDAHICTPATIAHLAQLTHCSLSTFKRKFKEIYHTSPGIYITEKRLEQVAYLLQISDDAISAIGYDCGFNSPEHLSRAFKKKYGKTPSAYRMNLEVKSMN